MGCVEEVSAEELECKICYSQYNLQSRRPKMLECCHSLCSKCLCKMLDVGDAFPREAVCPFCRYPTTLSGNCVSELPDNCHLLSALSMHGPAKKNLQVSPSTEPNPQLRRTCRYKPQEPCTVTTELLLNPQALTSLVGHSSPLASSLSSSSSSTTFSSLSSSPSFVLITIMEPRPRPQLTSSLDSLVSLSRSWGALLWQSWARVLLWALGLLYFSSLPVGVYLLLLHRPTMGVLMVSLVPASLALVMGYGLCQCLWHELRHCLSNNNNSLTGSH
ncbi:E3 ubiquitin-protein ligase RNF182 [Periophthalmus magnuspinnatus]|uniref:E3 ubiquitin-protein ligase RNF182 n=1 Tax=Periophthalmus magnuspinnatus TaxID=409849 RepID=UPI0024372E5D|nr:E3 ubiquitin-protein ligase RNF182 [Periophthalmus magnuspinnatus]